MTDDFRSLLEDQGRTFHAVQNGIERLNDRCDSIETALGRSLRGTAEADSLEEKRQAERFAALVTGRLAPAGGEEGETDLESYRLYRGVLSKYLRYGLTHLTPEENQALVMGRVSAKALSVGIEADGGYWVTPQISDRVIQRQFDTSPLRTIANVVTIGSDAIEFPTDSNDLISGGWVGESDARGETATPEIGIKRIPVHEQFANPRATQKLLDDAAFPVEQWLADKIADKFIREENAAFVSGNGVSKPRGFLDYGGDATTEDDSARNWGLLQYVPSGNASGFDSTDPGDALIDLVHKLKPVYRVRAVWVMSRATAAEVRKFKDGQGNYLWSGGNVQEGLQQRLLGFPVVEAEDMPDVGGSAFPIAFGDFMAGYQIVDRQGVRTLRDPFTAKPFVQFYTTKRVGGDVADFDAIKLFKIATS